MIRLIPRASKGLQRAAVRIAMAALLGWALLGAGPSCRNGSQPDATAKTPASRLPKIDVHLHIDLTAGAEALAILAENGIELGLNASGGEPGEALDASVAFAKEHGGRLQPYCNVRLSDLLGPDAPTRARATMKACKDSGGRGLKISKFLGLGLTDDSGLLVPVDDHRLDALFDAAGELGLPVLIHSGDPKAFFEPNTPNNERYDELRVHPGWSFYGVTPNGQPWPSWESLLRQHEARVARHPKTTFLGAHFGNAAEDPDRVARMLRTYPNYVIDTAARVPEFGRHDASRMRRFFIEFQDRILFGSDMGVGPDGLTLGSGGERPGTRAEAKPFFDRHWLYFETAGKHMPHPTPIQGRWTVDGISLPRAVLAKIYASNAARVFRLPLPRNTRD